MPRISFGCQGFGQNEGGNSSQVKEKAYKKNKQE